MRRRRRDRVQRRPRGWRLRARRRRRGPRGARPSPRHRRDRRDGRRRADRHRARSEPGPGDRRDGDALRGSLGGRLQRHRDVPRREHRGRGAALSATGRRGAAARRARAHRRRWRGQRARRRFRLGQRDRGMHGRFAARERLRPWPCQAHRARGANPTSSSRCRMVRPTGSPSTPTAACGSPRATAERCFVSVPPASSSKSWMYRRASSPASASPAPTLRRSPSRPPTTSWRRRPGARFCAPSRRSPDPRCRSRRFDKHVDPDASQGSPREEAADRERLGEV
jgi:hypothetical protein